MLRKPVKVPQGRYFINRMLQLTAKPESPPGVPKVVPCGTPADA
jgi:hypothetical protein